MKPVKHRIVHLEFLDHAMNDGTEIRPVTCQAYGVLFAEDKDTYYVASWLAENTPDHNMESFSILKKVVTKKVFLEPRNVRRQKRKASN
jgi:hypothetical protein